LRTAPDSLDVILEVPTFDSFLIVPIAEHIYRSACRRSPTFDIAVIPTLSSSAPGNVTWTALSLRPFVEPRQECVGLGGTFDRLHIGHRMLLTAAAFLATKTLLLAVSQQVANKYRSDLIQPFPDRAAAVVRFVYKVNPNLSVSCEPLHDVAGSAATCPSIDLLVLSEETIKGGDYVNEMRKANGLNVLHYAAINLVTMPNGEPLNATYLRQLDARAL
jgi:phosphopantetheine adenylyltransferase